MQCSSYLLKLQTIDFLDLHLTIKHRSNKLFTNHLSFAASEASEKMNFILVETNTILVELRNPRNIAIYIVLAGFMTVFTLVWISVVHCYLKDIRQRYVLR